MSPEHRPRLLPHERAIRMSRLGKGNEAISYLKRRLKRHPHDVESRYVLAMRFDERGPATVALPFYEQVVQERPGWADAQDSLGWMYGMKLGRYQEGIEHLTLATELDPDNPHRYYALGAVYWCAGQLSDARDAFRRSLARTILPEEEYMRRNVIEHLSVLDRRLRGDLRSVYPRGRVR